MSWLSKEAPPPSFAPVGAGPDGTGQRVTDWSAAPSTATHYGSVVCEKRGQTEYFDGYSNDEDPNVEDLVPAGWGVIESSLSRIR